MEFVSYAHTHTHTHTHTHALARMQVIRLIDPRNQAVANSFPGHLVYKYFKLKPAIGVIKARHFKHSAKLKHVYTSILK